MAQSCLTLCDPMDYTVNEILQARILEGVAFSFSRVSSQPRDQTQVSCIAGRFFISWATGEAQEYWSGSHPFSSGFSWPRNRTRVSCITGRFFTNWDGSQRRPDNIALCSRGKKNHRTSEELCDWWKNHPGLWTQISQVVDPSFYQQGAVSYVLTSLKWS